eukprot:COSAG02_NODE_63096_length_264_cov_0.624242_1_plen_40_part_10
MTRPHTFTDLVRRLLVSFLLGNAFPGLPIWATRVASCKTS